MPRMATSTYGHAPVSKADSNSLRWFMKAISLQGGVAFAHYNAW